MTSGLDSLGSLGSAMLQAANAAGAAAEAAAKPKRIELERDSRGNLSGATVVPDEVFKDEASD